MNAFHQHIQYQKHAASRPFCVLQAISLLDNAWGEGGNKQARNAMVGLGA